jgi:ABC-type bacteriocin/lantibiotic exporter with double-glycine peptidase domain
MIPELNEFIINYIFKNLLKKYEKSYEDIEMGKLISRINSIPQYLTSIIRDFCVWTFPRLVTIFLINLYFFIINWKLGLLSIILILLFFAINYIFFKKCSVHSSQRHSLFEKKNQDTLDKLSNSYSIYSNGNVVKEINNYEENTRVYTNKYKENLSCLNNLTLITSVFIILLFIALNSFVVYLYLKKEISLTNLIAIFITIIYYTPCITTVNNILPDLIQYYGALISIDSFIDDLYKVSQDDDKEDSKKKNVNIKKGKIIIRNLTFGYKNNKNIFNHFHLTIEDKEKIAILGASGNGKSTLIKLIMGYYTIENNMIFIDDKDINHYRLNDLRKDISYVSQNNKLFNLSILENIQYGNNYTREEILNICNEINVSNIFKNLTHGLDTMAGIEGNNLSGGQRQMVHLLRCICQKNKIVILDEPTSALDDTNRENVIKAIHKISKNSTLILITHDHAILEIVDRFITLDSGRIISDQYLS